MGIFIERVENNIGKGESAGNQQFSSCPTMYKKAVFLGIIKTFESLVKH